MSYPAQSIAIPESQLNAAAIRLPSDQATDLLGRDNTIEWSVILYSERATDGFCHGSHMTTSGGTDQCMPLLGVFGCADLQVHTGNPKVAMCHFELKYDGLECSGGNNRTDIVEAGSEVDGIPIDANIKSVLVKCFGER
ncbi:hypothetical protein HD806DRAFT_552851 [Xylariaceae sp. AK1471]|nr:hypothetical protein HD806DRAFT_552851 [Xylariaceae sp. AK1471]